jgi:hypothetical protein
MGARPGRKARRIARKSQPSATSLSLFLTT